MIQQLIDFLYRHPKSALKNYRHYGGYLSYRKMLNGRAKMARASLQLPPVPSSDNGLPLYFLTGQKYLYQTLFCIQSLAKVSTEKFRFILVDDGTFDQGLMSRLAKQLPGATAVTSEVIAGNISRQLPPEKYPVLHQKRKIYPHIKKLTDVHTIDGPGWKLVLDSDMLFWREPLEMIEWLRKPVKPLHLVDCTESYGYSSQLMQELCGCTVPSLLNVGAIGLESGGLNWPDIERWTRELEAREGSTYYLEQALTAMIIGGQQTVVMPKDGYRVNPEYLGGPAAVLHHYVDVSKKLYFSEGWKKIIKGL